MLTSQDPTQSSSIQDILTQILFVKASQAGSQLIAKIQQSTSDVVIHLASPSFQQGVLHALKFGGYGALIGFAFIPAFLVVICCLGFTCSGIATGSAAACCQASIGDVRAGSLFSSLQSCAMGGKGICMMMLVLAIVGFFVGIGLSSKYRSEGE